MELLEHRGAALLFARVLLERGGESVRIPRFEEHEISQLLGGLVLPDGKVHAVFAGDVLKVPDAAVCELNATDALILADGLLEKT